jgi:glycosyltransferase involved in cell wall biosynthesis
VLPAYNEEELLVGTVEAIVAGLSARALVFEVLIVENGSVDATPVLARELATAHPEVSVLELRHADYGLALAAGIGSAKGEHICCFDVDHYDLRFLDAALALVHRRGVGVVLGSKRAAGSLDRRPLARRVLSWGSSGLCRRVLAMRASDAHGMKLLVRSEVGPLVRRCRSRGSVFDVELVVRAERAGIGVAELPVCVTARRPARLAAWRRVPEALSGVLWLGRALRHEARLAGCAGSGHAVAGVEVAARGRQQLAGKPDGA